MQTKGSLPFPYESFNSVETLYVNPVLVVSNWEKFTVYINGLEFNSYVAAYVATYEYRYVNWGREDGSLELNSWIYQQGT